ncbi:MAG: (Fe-S)-binding protein [Bacteroidetes bacterium]|nr:(Fe-S)-binding protein [Bacteroidota bacterium]
MEYIAQTLFILLLISGSVLFTINVRKIRRNILLGKNTDRSDHKKERWMTMVRVALGQSKMVSRPLPAVLHIFVYVGFIVINIEVIEIIVDGAFGTHRVLSFLGPLYSILIATFEILAVLVFLGCFIFFCRRNIAKVKRLASKDLDGWPRSDANYILIMEMLLMTAFLFMNAADLRLQWIHFGHYAGVKVSSSAFPVSSHLARFYGGASLKGLVMAERFCWWFHIVGIMAFLNYIPYSKHFHILLAFPNTFYSNLKAKGEFSNLPSVTNEVKAMLDPSFTPPPPPEGTVQRFGAKDVTDLSWKQLMDAYSCTECGRCTSSCPANITGKKLSPRKIMMDTRDRLEAVGKNRDENKGKFVDDGKSLLGDLITPEEVWACTSCNACVQECPVNIDPLSIIIDLRRFMVMEQSSAPNELNMMMTNIENNAAPWQFSPADRMNWANE